MKRTNRMQARERAARLIFTLWRLRVIKKQARFERKRAEVKP